MKTVAALFEHPMVPAEFGYSLHGALAAMALAVAIAGVLAALT